MGSRKRAGQQTAGILKSGGTKGCVAAYCVEIAYAANDFGQKTTLLDMAQA
jgi:hypothetical protein